MYIFVYVCVCKFNVTATRGNRNNESELTVTAGSDYRLLSAAQQGSSRKCTTRPYAVG